MLTHYISTYNNLPYLKLAVESVRKNSYYKNAPYIKWVNKVHEVLEGFKIHGMLPPEEEWALYHPKTIERQERQNNY